MTYFSDQPNRGGLSSAQLDALRGLADSLSPGQSLLAVRWLLARFDAAALTEDRLETAEDPESAPPSGLTVLYGSHSGHSTSIAKSLATKAGEKGWLVTLSSLADYARGNLKRERNLAVVVSTHGEGQPPESIVPFYDFLHGSRAPRLDDCCFAVLALGDRSYVRFCQAGKDFDLRLERLGAKRLLVRTDLDVDYEDDAELWTTKALDAFAPRMVSGKTAVLRPAPRQRSRIDRESPWAAELLECAVLSGRESTQHFVHLELSLEGSRIRYEPGDALGLRPQNDPTLVTQLIEALGESPDALVRVAEQEHRLADALTRKFEIQRVTPSSLRRYAALGAGGLADVVANAKSTAAYLEGRDWFDVLREHPTEIRGQEFSALLPELGARSYSIASCQAAHPDEVHLLVSRLSYDSHGRRRTGVASSYLADRVHPGDKLAVWVEANSSFRLPIDPNVPIVMIGAGTGVAPYRAFMQARAVLGAQGKNWVVFGNRSFRSDFTYQSEWLKWRDQGLLTRMDVAFSCDQGQKVYVTDKLRDAGRELYAWLEQDARVYLCGDRAKLSASVDRALTDLVMRHGGKSPEQAAAYLGQLQADHRYLKDVY